MARRNLLRISKNSTIPPLTYPLLLNGSKTMQAYNIPYDYSTVIDQQGILRFKGSAVPLQQIQQTIDQLLATDIEEPTPISRSFQLLENSPNPFNPNTTLQFVLPEARQIELQIFDSGGRLL